MISKQLYRMQQPDSARNQTMKKITRTLVDAVISLTDKLNKKQKSGITKGSDLTLKEMTKIMYDPDRRELVQTLFALNRAARTELVALMLLGRGDFKEFDAAVAHCCQYTRASNQVSYILGKTAVLSKYLKSGLKKA
jgi:hypothetical protein